MRIGVPISHFAIPTVIDMFSIELLHFEYPVNPVFVTILDFIQYYNEKSESRKRVIPIVLRPLILEVW